MSALFSRIVIVWRMIVPAAALLVRTVAELRIGIYGTRVRRL
jgi:hypothetical protein